jgi:hypothetical protein
MRSVKPGNDNHPDPEPAPRQPYQGRTTGSEGMPAIVTARKPRGRKAAWTDDGAETPESVKAFLRRRRRNRGTNPAFIAPIRHIFFSLGRS